MWRTVLEPSRWIRRTAVAVETIRPPANDRWECLLIHVLAEHPCCLRLPTVGPVTRSLSQGNRRAWPALLGWWIAGCELQAAIATGV